MQVGDPSSVTKDQDISFFLKARRLGPFKHLPLVENLEGVHTVGPFHFDDTHFSKGTTADDFKNLKVIFAQPKFLDFCGHGFHCKKNKIQILLYALLRLALLVLIFFAFPTEKSFNNLHFKSRSILTFKCNLLRFLGLSKHLSI